jgi:predicted kinase
MMLGYPGAGKTTIAKMVQQITHAVHLNSDEIRLELFPHPTFTQVEHDQLYQELNRRTRELLEAGKDVIYDANLNRKIHRQEKYDLCKAINAQPVLLWVQTAKPVAKQRRIEDQEAHQFVPQHEDPASMFDRLVDVFEEPAANEPYIAIDGTGPNEQYIRDRLSQA